MPLDSFTKMWALMSRGDLANPPSPSPHQLQREAIKKARPSKKGLVPALYCVFSCSLSWFSICKPLPEKKKKKKKTVRSSQREHDRKPSSRCQKLLQIQNSSSSSTQSHLLMRRRGLLSVFFFPQLCSSSCSLRSGWSVCQGVRSLHSTVHCPQARERHCR